MGRRPIGIKPKGIVQDAWRYTGKEPSVHIVIKARVFDIPIANGLSIQFTLPKEQIDLDL